MRPLDGNARVEKMTKEFSLAPSFVASALVHLVVLALASTLIGQRSHPNERNSISVALLEPAEEEKAIRPVREEIKRDGVEAAPTPLRHKSVYFEAPQPSTTQKETVKANENKQGRRRITRRANRRPAKPAAARPERTTELPAASGLPPAPGTRETVTARRSPVSVAARARLVYRHQ